MLGVPTVELELCIVMGNHHIESGRWSASFSGTKTSANSPFAHHLSVSSRVKKSTFSDSRVEISLVARNKFDTTLQKVKLILYSRLDPRVAAALVDFRQSRTPLLRKGELFLSLTLRLTVSSTTQQWVGSFVLRGSTAASSLRIPSTTRRRPSSARSTTPRGTGTSGSRQEIIHDAGRGAPWLALPSATHTASSSASRRSLPPRASRLASSSTVESALPSTLATSSPQLAARGYDCCATSRTRAVTVAPSPALRATTATIIGHDNDGKNTRIRLPSGAKKTVPSASRASVGIVAGGGRIDKPLLKAGRAHHKFKVKRNSWPKTRGVAMNPVDHPHGGGNHQHIGHASTVPRDSSAGQKAGLIAARRTGLIRGTVAKKDA
ncbi:hypothetical protein L7F22_021353 [Adiantum nelumboides]|nr:hypothetical protein [Adiantum nelumboides]